MANVDRTVSPVGLDLQLRLQFGDLGLALREFGTGRGGATVRVGKVRIGGRNQRAASCLFLATGRHRRLCLGQCLPCIRNVLGRVLLGIRGLRACHRLLRGSQFGGRWRQAGAGRHCK